MKIPTGTAFAATYKREFGPDEAASEANMLILKGDYPGARARLDAGKAAFLAAQPVEKREHPPTRQLHRTVVARPGAARQSALPRHVQRALDPGLADLVLRGLKHIGNDLDLLGLARREGVLVPGFEKCAAAIRAGKAAWLIEASDGAADGRGKLLNLARHQSTRVCGTFSADDLSLALGLENAIHAVLLAGGRADRWGQEASRLAGFRPLRPPEWGPERGLGGGSGSDEDRGDEPERAD
jgi:ribosomal protein L7Ae-like RNA K-turn-binding protein